MSWNRGSPKAKIEGWKHSPENTVSITGKVLTLENPRIVETKHGEEAVFDVHVGDPDNGGKIHHEVGVLAVMGVETDFAGLETQMGIDDSEQ